MKKYTNKILIIAAALFIVVTTTLFFIEAFKIKRELKAQTSLTINH